MSPKSSVPSPRLLAALAVAAPLAAACGGEPQPPADVDASVPLDSETDAAPRPDAPPPPPGAVLATGLVETAEAVYFQPEISPNVVWYFPRSKVRLYPYEVPLPDNRTWLAAVELTPITIQSVGQLRPDWAGKSLVPYILRPTDECVLSQVPEMRFVVEDTRAAGRDITAANAGPVCRFNFQLPAMPPDDLLPTLQEQAHDGTLIERHLRLEIVVAGELHHYDM